MSECKSIIKGVTSHTVTPKSVLDVDVSKINGYSDTNPPQSINLLNDWLLSDAEKDRIEYLRELKNKEQIKLLKSRLPAITPSGLFSQISENGLVKHSNLLAFDIDFKDNTHISNYGYLKQQIGNIPNVAYCGLSASGQGYWGLVLIAHPEKHKEHFEALYRIFKILGINIDRAPRNVASKRGISYDPKAYFNHHPIPFRQYDEIDIIDKTIMKHKDVNSANKLKKIKLYVGEIIRRGVDITDSYNVWFTIACAIANEFGEDGREDFHSISQFYNGYNSKEADKLFSNSLKKEYPIALGSFYFYCKKHEIIIDNI